VDKAQLSAYRDRRQRKRDFRRLWIARINAAARDNGTTYSEFIAGLKTAAARSTARCSPTSRPATQGFRPARGAGAQRRSAAGS